MGVRGRISPLSAAILLGAAIVAVIAVALSAAGPARGSGRADRDTVKPGVGAVVALASGDTVTVDLWRRPGGGTTVLHVTGGRAIVDTLRGQIYCLEPLRVGGRTARHVVVDTVAGTISGVRGGRRRILLRFDPRTFSTKPPDAGVYETWDIPVFLGGRPAGDLGMRVSAAAPGGRPESLP